ncbi:DUF1127 domain-containing protein [Rubellimicrobium roseum]|nr:DUF1127 domain-containing protein [Rubellimicrobium roseum]
MTTLTAPQSLATARRPGGPDRLAALRALARRMAAVARTGHARHDLRHLPDRMLADMGLTRADLDRL